MQGYLSSTLDPVLINHCTPRAPFLGYAHHAGFLTSNQGQLATETTASATEINHPNSSKKREIKNLKMLDDTGLQHQHIGTWQKYGLEHLPSGASKSCIHQVELLPRKMAAKFAEKLACIWCSYTSQRRITFLCPSLPYLQLLKTSADTTTNGSCSKSFNLFCLQTHLPVWLLYY